MRQKPKKNREKRCTGRERVRRLVLWERRRRARFLAVQNPERRHAHPLRGPKRNRIETSSHRARKKPNLERQVPNVDFQCFAWWLVEFRKRNHLFLRNDRRKHRNRHSSSSGFGTRRRRTFRTRRPLFATGTGRSGSGGGWRRRTIGFLRVAGRWRPRRRTRRGARARTRRHLFFCEALFELNVSEVDGRLFNLFGGPWRGARNYQFMRAPFSW